MSNAGSEQREHVGPPMFAKRAARKSRFTWDSDLEDLRVDDSDDQRPRPSHESDTDGQYTLGKRPRKLLATKSAKKTSFVGPDHPSRTASGMNSTDPIMPSGPPRYTAVKSISRPALQSTSASSSFAGSSSAGASSRTVTVRISHFASAEPFFSEIFPSLRLLKDQHLPQNHDRLL
jgi:hypothetical protein